MGASYSDNKEISQRNDLTNRGFDGREGEAETESTYTAEQSAKVLKVEKNHDVTEETARDARKAASDIIGYAEAAELLGIPLNTCYGLVHARRLPHYRLGSRSVRFSRQRLLAYLAEHAVEVK